MVTVKAEEVVALIEELAPPGLAEAWDNSGWQVGDPNQEVDRVMVALDIDEQVAGEAVEKGVQLIISHHPLIMKGLKSIRLDTAAGRLTGKLIRAGIGAYAAHTNLDSTRGGINDRLAQKLGLQDTRVLFVVEKEKYLKLVVFVPESHLQDVMGALRRQGAGWIGNYSDCTFQVKGTGTFRPGEGTDPYIGKQGELERVEEVRLETIVPAPIVDKVLKAVIDAHPYEEVAYDLYPLALEGPAKGLGRVGNLSSPVKFSQFVQLVRQALNLSNVRFGGEEGETVNRVAICSGSGADLWPAARAMGAQVLVTGDVKYHAARDMLAGGIKFVDAGHYGTEKIVVELLGDYLKGRTRDKGMDVEVLESKRGFDPFRYA